MQKLTCVLPVSILTRLRNMSIDVNFINISWKIIGAVYVQIISHNAHIRIYVYG